MIHHQDFPHTRNSRLPRHHGNRGLRVTNFDEAVEVDFWFAAFIQLAKQTLKCMLSACVVTYIDSLHCISDNILQNAVDFISLFLDILEFMMPGLYCLNVSCYDENQDHDHGSHQHISVHDAGINVI